MSDSIPEDHYEVDVTIDFGEDGKTFDIKFSGIEIDYADAFFRQVSSGTLAEAIKEQLD